MKILYIFPHPDDESFGPAAAMHKQRREGHEVYLLTLTKGGATKQREKYGLSVEEMGEVRYKEMLEVAKALNLSGMTVLDLPDSGLKEMDPRDIEKVIEDEIHKIKPDVVVTYPVHGISGFHDHLISHAVVKSVFVRLKEECGYPRRLAFYTVTAEDSKKQKHFRLNFSRDEEIDCKVKLDEVDVQKRNEALECYVTFKETIDNTDIKNQVNEYGMFEFYMENFNPKAEDVFENLK